MANVLLGVTGSVAALQTPALFSALSKAGHQVKVVATNSSLYFFDPSLGNAAGKRDPAVVIVDEDEWPGRGEDRTWQRGDPVLHIELRRWADTFAIAPLDANTLAKLALGICDNCLTCVWRAWDRTRPVVLAPAMNTLMWEHPATARHVRQVSSDLGVSIPTGLSLDELMTWINANLPNLRMISPINKRLACDDVGMGAMAGVDDIVATIATLCSRPH